MSASSPTVFVITRAPNTDRQITRVLATFGIWSIKHCTSLSDASQLVLLTVPHLIILDCDIAEVAKITHFLQKWVKRHGRKTVPIVMLSKDLSPHLLALASEFGIYQVLRPDPLDNLRMTIGSALEEQRTLSMSSTQLIRIESAAERKLSQVVDRRVEDLYKSHPTLFRAQLEFANLCLRKKDIIKAFDLARQMHQKNPTNLRVINLLARCYFHQGKAPQALEVLCHAELLNLKNLDWLIVLGDLYRSMGKAKFSITGQDPEIQSKKIETDAQKPASTENLPEFVLSEHGFHQALELLRDVTSEDELAGFFNNAAVYSIKSNKFEKGIRLYQCAKRLSDDMTLTPKIVFNIGIAYQKWNRMTEAEAHFEEAVKLDPSYEKAQRYLEMARSARLERNPNPASPFSSPVGLLPASSTVTRGAKNTQNARNTIVASSQVKGTFDTSGEFQQSLETNFKVKERNGIRAISSEEFISLGKARKVSAG